MRGFPCRLGSGAAAANAVRLATEAVQISARLGALLRRIAEAIRAYQEAGRAAKLLGGIAINWVGNTGGTLLGSTLAGKDADIGEAVWQGGLAAAVGTPIGAGAAGAVGSWFGEAATIGKSITENVAGGVAGNVAGGAAVDATTALTTDETPEWGTNALVNAAGGLVGGLAVGGASHYRQGLDSNPVNPDFNYPHATPNDRASMGIEGPAGAVGAGLAGVGNELLPEGEEEQKKKSQPQSPFARQQHSIEEDFG